MNIEEEIMNFIDLKVLEIDKQEYHDILQELISDLKIRLEAVDEELAEDY